MRWAACWRKTSSRRSACRRTTTRRWTAMPSTARSSSPTRRWTLEVVGHGAGRQGLAGHGGPGPVREDHDRRHHAGRAWTPWCRRSSSQAARRRPHRAFPPRLLQPGDNRRLEGRGPARGPAGAAPRRAPHARRLRAGRQPGHRHGAGAAPAARGLLLHRRRNPEPGRAAARRRGVRQQPLHGVRPAQAPGLRGDRHGRGARRSGAAGSRLYRAPPPRPTPSSPAAASASARPTTPRP